MSRLPDTAKPNRSVETTRLVYLFCVAMARDKRNKLAVAEVSRPFIYGSSTVSVTPLKAQLCMALHNNEEHHARGPLAVAMPPQNSRQTFDVFGGQRIPADEKVRQLAGLCFTI